MDKDQFIKAHEADSKSDKCRSVAQEESVTLAVTYLFDEGVLLHKWSPVFGMVSDVVAQVVLEEFLTRPTRPGVV